MLSYRSWLFFTQIHPVYRFIELTLDCYILLFCAGFGVGDQWLGFLFVVCQNKRRAVLQEGLILQLVTTAMQERSIYICRPNIFLLTMEFLIFFAASFIFSFWFFSSSGDSTIWDLSLVISSFRLLTSNFNWDWNTNRHTRTRLMTRQRLDELRQTSPDHIPASASSLLFWFSTLQCYRFCRSERKTTVSGFKWTHNYTPQLRPRVSVSAPTTSWYSCTVVACSSESAAASSSASACCSGGTVLGQEETDQNASHWSCLVFMTNVFQYHFKRND